MYIYIFLHPKSSAYTSSLQSISISNYIPCKFFVITHFSNSYSAHGILFLSFLASLSPLAFSRPMYIFVGPVTHYSCRLGLMGFLLFILSILCGPHYWALLSTRLPQMALNIKHVKWLGLGQPALLTSRVRVEGS